MKNLKPILLVEDNLNDIELTRAALKHGQLANEIIVARNGAEALDYFYRRGQFKDRPEDQLPVVVFLDLKMPKVDGLEVLRQMKADETLKLVPVVMLTSSNEESDLIRSYQMGVNAYVVKPVGFERFAEAVRQLGMFWVLLNEIPSEKVLV